MGESFPLDLPLLATIAKTSIYMYIQQMDHGIEEEEVGGNSQICSVNGALILLTLQAIYIPEDI